MYFKIIILTGGILLLFRILSLLNKTLPFSKEFKHYSGYLIPVVEFLVWIGFFIWCMRVIYESESYMTLIIFGIALLFIIVPGWFLVRDFLFGVLLKIQRKIKVDDNVEIGEIKGVIVKTEYFSFDVKTNDGDIDTIPYNKIRSKVISKIGANSKLQKQRIAFQIPSKYPVSKTTTDLLSTLINAPWVVSSQNPIINNIREEAEKYTVEVFVFVIKNEHVDKITEYVQHNFIKKLS